LKAEEGLMKAYGWGALAALALLAACGGGETGGVTAEESQQLNEAAEMLDAAPDTLVAADESGLGNGEAAVAPADTGDVLVADNRADGR
jgi:hypothetical protein